MTHRIDRRQALATFGAVSLSGLLAACGDEGERHQLRHDAARARPAPSSRRRRRPRRFPSSSTSRRRAPSRPRRPKGPYYFDVDSIRSDIREDREGVAAAARPPGARREVVRADRERRRGHLALRRARHLLRVRVGVDGRSRRRQRPTDDETYLRGAQATNADGIVEFKTVYPGWYSGRTVHIHAKVHLDKQTVLTTQLFFDESVNEAVYKRKPYSQRTGRDMFNDNDGIFDEALLVSAKRRATATSALMTFDVTS